MQWSLNVLIPLSNALRIWITGGASCKSTSLSLKYLWKAGEASLYSLIYAILRPLVSRSPCRSLKTWTNVGPWRFEQTSCIILTLWGGLVWYCYHNNIKQIYTCSCIECNRKFNCVVCGYLPLVVDDLGEHYVGVLYQWFHRWILHFLWIFLLGWIDVILFLVNVARGCFHWWGQMLVNQVDC